MKRRWSLVAWSLFGLFVVVSGIWVALAQLNGEDLVENTAFSILYGAFALVGALIASRKPDNSLGWIFLWIGIAANLGNGASSYATYTLATEPGALPAGEWAGWLGSFMWPTAITSILFLLALFPSGRAQNSFERWLLGAAALAVFSLNVGSFVLKPGPIDVTGVEVQNPAGLESLTSVLQVLSLMGAVLVPAVAFTAVVTLVVRARRSRGIERQQLRWFGYSALAMIFFNFIIGNLLEVLVPSLRGSIGNIMFVAGLAFIPLGTGVAILRYRLYELDLIVNRTLVYGAMTALLAAAYLGSVFLLQGMLEPITRESDLAIAGSTLAVAALFRPLRERVQSFIDHRFYRRKYDAVRTLQGFAGRLRDEVDLDSLGRELVGVVGRTMQPAHVSLWLRAEGTAPPSPGAAG